MIAWPRPSRQIRFNAIGESLGHFIKFHRADVKALAHYPRRIELPMSGPTFVFGDVEGKLDVLLLPCRRRSEG
jgi:hypothetical protein